MEYQALYRKYRPQRFDEVVGQDHITRTLGREIVDGKVAHAYLFTGPRGTGKTTTARLLAKALNCPDRDASGEPCNDCDSCAGIAAATSLDVIELDAASHNKVEDVREIRVNVATVAAAAGARRVYILDEAHMLSRAAGNALLKTLEEPPEHVIFVLATTEPYKLLDTIRSRSQRFDFHPVSSEVLTAHLADIAGRESFETTPEALSLVAGHARGSVRDALSLLEQVAALGGGKVDRTGVTRALGIADRDAFAALVQAMAGHDAPAALGLVAELAGRGADLRRFVADAVALLRGIFLAQYAPNLEEVVDEPPEVLAEWRSLAGVLSAGEVLRAVDLLGDALTQLRQGREERLIVELALIRLTRPETTVEPGALATRLDRLEKAVKRLGEAPPAPPPGPAAPLFEPAVQAAAERTRPAGAPETAADHSSDETPSEQAPSEQAPSEQAPSEQAPSDRPFSSHQPSPAQTGAAPAAPDPAVSDPAPAADPAAPPEPDVDLASVEAVWPAIVARVRETCGPRRHALVKEAAPAAVDEGVVVLEVPSHLVFHLERMEADTELHEAIAELTADLVGRRLRVAFRLGEQNEPGLFDADPAAGSEPSRAPDKDDLEEGGGGDPMGLVVDMLGGQIVDE